jgi:hypothetical protein
MEFTRLYRDERSTEHLKKIHGFLREIVQNSKLAYPVNEVGVKIIKPPHPGGVLIHIDLKCTETKNI